MSAEERSKARPKEKKTSITTETVGLLKPFNTEFVIAGHGWVPSIIVLNYVINCTYDFYVDCFLKAQRPNIVQLALKINWILKPTSQ